MSDAALASALTLVKVPNRPHPVPYEVRGDYTAREHSVKGSLWSPLDYWGEGVAEQLRPMAEDLQRQALPEEERLQVAGLQMVGGMNTPYEDIYANLRYAIRQQHPQVFQQAVNGEVACIVGGGASLQDTEAELVELWHQGAKVFTVNGSYHWCLERHIKPWAQVVVDARGSNLRFLYPDYPKVRYLLSSQCHPTLWDAVRDREMVGIWHALTPDDPGAAILNEYYQKQWHAVTGGITVGTRAIGLAQRLGFIRLHLFGVDCCFLHGEGHAYAMPENVNDQRVSVTFTPTTHPEEKRVFEVSPWHLKNLEDTLRYIKHGGDNFLMAIHGDGLLAYALRTNAIQSSEE
jgi:hypothetical protein